MEDSATDRARGPPILRSHVPDILRKGPPVSRNVLCRVLADAEGHVDGRRDNLGAARLCMCVVLLHIVDRNVNVRCDVLAVGRAIGAALPAKHDGAFPDVELRVANDAALRCAQSLDEPKRLTEPANRLADRRTPDIAVDQTGITNHSNCSNDSPWRDDPYTRAQYSSLFVSGMELTRRNTIRAIRVIRDFLVGRSRSVVAAFRRTPDAAVPRRERGRPDRNHESRKLREWSSR